MSLLFFFKAAHSSASSADQTVGGFYPWKWDDDKPKKIKKPKETLEAKLLRKLEELDYKEEKLVQEYIPEAPKVTELNLIRHKAKADDLKLELDRTLLALDLLRIEQAKAQVIEQERQRRQAIILKSRIEFQRRLLEIRQEEEAVVTLLMNLLSED